jgi:hypothetical protein
MGLANYFTQVREIGVDPNVKNQNMIGGSSLRREDLGHRFNRILFQQEFSIINL